MIKGSISGKLVSSGISHVAFASVLLGENSSEEVDYYDNYYYNPYKNVEHALRTLYTQFAFVLHSFCALVNHILHYVQNVRHKQNIGHMRKMCAGGIHCNMCAVCAQSSRYVQNMRSLRTILKICAQDVQFAHIIK